MTEQGGPDPPVVTVRGGPGQRVVDPRAGAALRAAQRITIAKPDYSHPYFWGAYFLVGDASKTMLSTGSQAKTRVAAK